MLIVNVSRYSQWLLKPACEYHSWPNSTCNCNKYIAVTKSSFLHQARSFLELGVSLKLLYALPDVIVFKSTKQKKHAGQNYHCKLDQHELVLLFQVLQLSCDQPPQKKGNKWLARLFSLTVCVQLLKAVWNLKSHQASRGSYRTC